MTAPSQISSTDRAPSFRVEDVEQVENYRPLSKLALAGLLFGLAAPVCLLAPLLFVIPLVGIAISIAALRHVANHQDTLDGRTAASLGLGLCVATVMAAVSYASIIEHLRSNQASAFGQQWISLLLAGKTPEAFSLTLTSLQPPPPMPGEPPANRKNPYEEFMKNPTVEALVAAGEGAGIRFDKSISYQALPRGKCAVAQNFRVTPTKGGPPIDVKLILERSASEDRRGPKWLVRNIETP